MRRTVSLLAATLSLAALAWPRAALANPKVALIDDGDTLTENQIVTSLQASGMFATTDVIDASFNTPTVATLKMYDAVVVFGGNFNLFFDQQTLGNNLAMYVDAGGGVVEMMYALDGFDGPMGNWTGTYECLTGAMMGELANASPLKAAPNDANSPIVQGVGGITAQQFSRSDAKLNNGATSVWDYSDGAPGVCSFKVNGHTRVDLNFDPTTFNFIDKNQGDAMRLIKNALLFVSGGFNPVQGMPNTVNFPDTGTFATSNTQTITYKNTGMMAQTVTAVTISAGNTNDFTITQPPTLPQTLQPNASFTVGVAFTPLVAGQRSATLSATVTAQMSTADVTLSGKALPVSLKVTPNPIAFGGTQIGMPLMKPITIQNLGMAAVSVTGLSVTIGGTVYTIPAPPQLPINLVANASFMFNLMFAPTVNGQVGGQLTVTSTDANSPMLLIPITGCAGPGAITLDAGTLAYGNINVGASSPSQVTITNTGCADLKVMSITLGGADVGQFSLDTMNAIGSIPTNTSQKFTVFFTPTSVGMKNASVTVVSDAGTKAVTLQGTGTTVTPTVMPGNLDFGTVKEAMTSAAMNVTVATTGTGTLHVLQTNFTGADASSFSQMGGMVAPFDIAPNGSSMLPIICKPAKTGPLTATLTVVTDVDMHSVALTCTGTAPVIGVNPTSINFGSVSQGTTSMPVLVTLTNTGTDVLNISSFSVIGTNSLDFNTNDLTPPAMIAPNGSLTFHMVYSPSMSGAESASAEIDSDDPITPALMIGLTGNGVTPMLSVNPDVNTGLDFGMVMIGSKSAPKTVTYTNSGQTKITIMSIKLSGTNATVFSVDNAGPISLNPNDTATVMVTFSPTNSTAAMATLTAQPDQGLGALALPLKGLGIGAGVSVNPPSASFGSVTVGLASDAKTFTIMNTGSIAAKIDSVGPAVNTDMSPNPNFVVDTSKTSLMLAKGASTTFNVSFDPTSEGSETATVPIVVGGKTLAMVGVSGTGTAPMAMGNCGCALGAKRPRPPLGALAIAALALLGMLGARRRTRARR